MSANQSICSAPAKRCAIGVKNNVQYLFVTIPKLVSSKHMSRQSEVVTTELAKVELPELMLFGNSNKHDENKDINITNCNTSSKTLSHHITESINTKNKMDNTSSTTTIVGTNNTVTSPLDELFGFLPTSTSSTTITTNNINIFTSSSSSSSQQKQQPEYQQPSLSSPLDELFNETYKYSQQTQLQNKNIRYDNTKSKASVTAAAIANASINNEKVPQKEKSKVEHERYESGKLWAHGYHVIPLIVNGNGEVCCSKDLGKYYYNSFTEIHTTCGPFDAFVECAALFGGILLDKVYMLVATETESVARLPVAGSIMRVTETRWVAFDLPGIVPVKMSSDDKARLEELHKYTFQGGYYYSDMVDLRLPFPFVRGLCEIAPNFMCDWSWHLRAMFHVGNNDNATDNRADTTNDDYSNNNNSRNNNSNKNSSNVCRNMSSHSIVNSHINAHYLRHACSTLLRGFASERVTSLRDSSQLHLLLLGRQSTLNPGPRYLGRGLNALHGVGNDHFYEYVLWVEPNRRSSSHTSSSSIVYARHAILRGTVPVHWSTQLSVSLAEPPMTFSSNKSEVLHGSDVYFAQTFETLSSLMSFDSRGKNTLQPRLRCLSLLRLNAQGNEDVLARFYREAVVQSEGVIKLGYPHALLDLVHIDWLNLIKEYGIDVATSTLWESAITFLVHLPSHTNTSSPTSHPNSHYSPLNNFANPFPPTITTTTTTTTATTANVNNNNNNNNNVKNLHRTANETKEEQSDEESMITVGLIRQDGAVERLTTQSRFLRINCADSLDRTNLACYFICLQMSIAMLMTMQIPFSHLVSESSITIPPLDANADEEGENAYSAAFAPVACAKKIIPKPFLSSWSDARDSTRIPHTMVHLLAELFVENGDCVAMLYTNSAAMHGNILRGLCKMKRTAHNAVIATQRKFENIFEDSSKFRIVELLLGRHTTVHLPSISQVFLTRPVPYRCWACALIVVGVPVETTIQDVDKALRECWDERVNPYLRQSKQPAIDSAALCVTITIQGNDRRRHKCWNRGEARNTICNTSSSSNNNINITNNKNNKNNSKSQKEITQQESYEEEGSSSNDDNEFAEGLNASHRSFTESLIKDNRKNEADDAAFAIAVSQLSNARVRDRRINSTNETIVNDNNNNNNNNSILESTSSNEPTSAVPVIRTENIVVIEIDENLCGVVDAPGLLRREGYLTIRGCNCVLAQYSYPQLTENEKGKGSTMKNVGASFKRGLKNFMRSLN